MVKIKFVKTHDNAKLPVRNHGNITVGNSKSVISGTHDTCYDIFACEETFISPKNSAVVPTGIKVGFITPGYWIKVESRSGLSFKNSVLSHPGIIDNPYRGDMGVKLYNHGNEPYIVTVGEKIAQIAVYELINFEVEWTNEVQETHRGEKGFGSSGTH